MFSTPRPVRLLAALSLLQFLTVAGCVHPSTPSSIARTERPRMPTLSAEAVKTERLSPISGKTSGELVTVDKGWLTEILERLAQAIGAVERGNNRVGARNTYDRCVRAILETGNVPADCPTAPAP